MALIKNILRPKSWNPHTESMEPADALRVELDLYEDGSFIDVVSLQFADHAGLEAEWDAGLVTTVLEAAIADVLAGAEDDPLPAGHRSSIGGQVVPAEE